MAQKKILFDEKVAARKLQRMALEIAEQLNADGTGVVLLGIKTNGSVICEALARELRHHLPSVTTGSIGLNKQHPQAVEVTGLGDANGKNIVVVDDVSNSGRTLLYALRPLLDYHPRRIQTMVLVERMHKQFPIKPDYVGLSVATAPDDFIQVEVGEGNVLGAYLVLSQ